MGFLAGVAGVIFSSRSNGAQPAPARCSSWTPSPAPSSAGGRDRRRRHGRRRIVGGLIMAVMSNGMQLMGVDQSIQSVVKGLVLLLAVAFDVYNKRRAGASR
jgi:putative multiple sugar transport system permease protein